MCIPGIIWCCANAGAGTDASASALVAIDNAIFTDNLQREAPRLNGASPSWLLQQLAGVAAMVSGMAVVLGVHVLAAILATILLLLLVLHWHLPLWSGRGGGSGKRRGEQCHHVNSPEFEWKDSRAQAVLGGGVAVSG
jgi:hypothetical protein